MMSPVQLEYALADCLRELVRFVEAQSQSGARDEQAPALAYCLTPKQCDDMDRVCDESGWERLNSYAIMINPSDIRHILASRSKKDNLDCTQIAEIVAKAYSPRSLVRRNPPTFDPTAERRGDQQSVMLNTQQKFTLNGTAYYATAILEIRVSGARRYLAPVTCYHATEAKKRKILK